MRKALLPLAAVALVALLAVGLLQAGGGEKASEETTTALRRAQVGRAVPGVPADLAALRRRVNALDRGGAKAFEAQLRALRGHPVVVNLWASWCGPCRFEIPFFQRQALERVRAVAFLGVNTGDNHGDASTFLERFPLPYPSYEDPRQRLLGRFGARGLPVTVFYDARGRRQFVHQGVFPTEQQLADAIDRYT